MLHPDKLRVQKDYPLEFANPTYDISFKQLFGNIENERIIIDFINTLFDFEGENTITGLEVFSTENTPLLGMKKKSSVDVKYLYKGITQKGQVIIEMQRANPTYFMDRLQYYTAYSLCNTVNSYNFRKQEETKLRSPYAISPIYTLVIYTTHEEKEEKNYLIKNELIENSIAYTTLDDQKVISSNKTYFKVFELNKFRSLISNIIQSQKQDLKDLCYKDYKNFFTKELCYPNKYSLEKKEVIISSNFYKKIQWLDFLSYCHKKYSLPSNVSESITASYQLMQLSLWKSSDRMSYNKVIYDSLNYEAELQVNLDKERKEGVNEGMRIGEINGEIGKVRDFKELGINFSTICNKKYIYLKINHINKILEEKSWEDLSNIQIFEELQKGSEKIIDED